MWALVCRENRRAAQGEEGDDSEDGPVDEHDSQEADDSGASRLSTHTAICHTPSGTLVCLRLVKREVPYMYLLSQSRVFSETAGKIVAGLLMQSS